MTYILYIIDVEQYLDTLKGSSNDQDTEVVTLVYPSTSYNKKKTFSLTKQNLRCLRQRSHYHSSGFVWLNDQVQQNSNFKTSTVNDNCVYYVGC